MSSEALYYRVEDSMGHFGDFHAQEDAVKACVRQAGMGLDPRCYIVHRSDFDWEKAFKEMVNA